jgi:hypothetical protein
MKKWWVNLRLTGRNFPVLIAGKYTQIVFLNIQLLGKGVIEIIKLLLIIECPKEV